ncbi:ScbA/BarX family gamma-butyrolactone biosynthesis protein [Allokutzneria multivorans]|uniref:ScbA/BarX family gamma-butyrolactone biosynthesis protein n=1 Tax=Allokutzneria multivorans TaxID=1142134 RepID=A0ABP7R163_9PSEU
MTTLDFSQIVPHKLVHRASLCEVFLTSAVGVDADTFDVGTQVPRTHSLYGDRISLPTHYDPLLYVEAARQACIYIAHQYFGAPLGYHFILRDAEMEVVDHGGLTVLAVPTNAVLRCSVVRRFKNRDGEVTGLRVLVTLLVSGEAAMTVQMSYSWVPAEKWESMRADNRVALALPLEPHAAPLPPRANPASVDRLNPANVVISPPRATTSGRTSSLVVDTAHPALFDHPLDHVPGMLQLEAFRQLAITTAGFGKLTGMSAKFVGFGELDLPNECESAIVSAGDDVEVRCAVRQEGRTVAEALVTLVMADRPAVARPVRG